MTLLGVDIGTTHVKACAYDEEGRFLGASRLGTPTSRSQGGGAEYDARAMERAVFEVIRQVVERFGSPRAIGVSSMAESGFLLDGPGEPLAPAIAWFDGRTAPQAARWEGRLDPLELFSRTGLHLAPRGARPASWSGTERTRQMSGQRPRAGSAWPSTWSFV